jgi:hypothetical protein
MLIGQARLLSLLPHPLHAAFNIPPSRFPDRAQRSRLFFDALQGLADWWSQTFFDVSDPTLGLRTRAWDEVQEVVDTLPRLKRADLFENSFENPTVWTDRLEKIAEGSGGEKLRSPNSLMKKVLQQEGSRDISAQLFVSLARACGLGTRLVVSLQPVPWRAEKVAPKKKTGAGRGGKSRASRQGDGEPSDEENSEEDMEEVPIPDPANEAGGPGEVIKKIKNKPIRGAGRRRHIDPADVYRLRKPAPQKVGSAPKPKKRREGESASVFLGLQQIFQVNRQYFGLRCFADRIKGGFPLTRSQASYGKRRIMNRPQMRDQYGCYMLLRSKKVRLSVTQYHLLMLQTDMLEMSPFDTPRILGRKRSSCDRRLVKMNLIGG